MVTIYKRADGQAAPSISETNPETDGRYRLGYNPAEEARSISREDWESVKCQREGTSKWATAQLPWIKDSKTYDTRAKL